MADIKDIITAKEEAEKTIQKTIWDLSNKIGCDHEIEFDIDKYETINGSGRYKSVPIIGIKVRIV
jgi:hypothetical protein